MPGPFSPGHIRPTGTLWSPQRGTGTDVRIIARPSAWSAATVSDVTQSTSPALVISPNDNDLVVIAITIDVASGSLANSVISCNAGQTWTKIGETNDASFTDHRFAWFYRKWQQGDDTSITFTCNVSAVATAVEWALAGCAWGGTSDTTPIGTYAFNTETATSNTPTHTTKTISPAGANSWIGYIAQDRTGSSMTTPPTGYVNRVLSRPGTAPTGVNPSVNMGDSNKEVAKANPVTLTYTASGSSIVAGNLIFEIVAFGQSSNPPPQLSLGPIIGAVSDTSVTVTYGFSGLATTARLAVTTDSTYTTGLTYSSSTSQSANGLCKMTVSGLTANTTYYIAAEGDGALMLSGRGSFKTNPTAGVAANFSLAFSSCQFTVPTTVAFNRIKARVGAYGNARMLIHMGDMHYRDWSSSNVRSDILNQWFDSMNSSGPAAMAATVPMTYCWDNHDWGGEFSDKNNPVGALVASAAREVWPAYALPATDSVGYWQTWTIGRVRFIQIDPRSQRNPYTDAESSSKSMLGTEQKAWLKARLQDPEPVKIICGNMYWRSDGGATGDRWSSYLTEWQELTDFINNTSGVAGRVYVLFGDTHALCADNGTSSTTGGIPQAGGAPLQQGALVEVGNSTWSQGYYTDAGGAVIQCYGWLDIGDTGTQITIDYKGYEATSDTVQVSMSTVINTATVAAAAAAGAGAASATALVITAGSATAAGAGVVTATPTQQAAATATGAGAVTATPAVIQQATATAVGAGVTLAASRQSAASSPTGVGSATATGLVVVPGAASAVGAGSVTASAAGTTTASATAVGAGAATATIVQSASATAAGAGAVTAASRQSSTSSATGLGAATAAGTVTVPGSATAVGAGSATANAGGSVTGSASVTGAGVVAAAAVQSATATAVGVGAATATTVQRGQTSVTGAGATTAGSVQSAASSVAGAGSASANAGGTGNGAATATAAGTVSAGAVQAVIASATGAGSVTAAVTATATATAAGAGTTLAVTTQRGGATVTGAGAAVAGAQGTTNGAATVTAAGSATAAATVVVQATATAAGVSATSSAGSIRGSAAPVGAGATSAGVVQRVVAVISGAGAATGTVGQTIAGSASPAGAGAVTAAGGTKYTTRPFTGTTTRQASGTTTRPFTTTTVRP